MESPVFAKGPAGEYCTDLAKSCEDHFNRIYPECENSTNHETVMCPPVFPFGYVAPTCQASGAKALSKVEEDTIRGGNAELKIFELLENWGQNTKQPMFVLTQLRLSEFSKNLPQQVLPADHPASSKNFNGEIELVLLL